MDFQVGQKVLFVHTGESGVVASIISKTMVNVHLVEDDMEIPVSIEDLQLAPLTTQEEDKVKKRIQASKKKTQSPPKIEVVPETKGPNKGKRHLFLAFEDLLNREGGVFGYSLHLINNTDLTLVYQFSLEFEGKPETKGNGSLPPFSNIRVAKMHHIQLNDAPVFRVNCQPYTTQGKEKWISKALKVKAKQFFKNIDFAPQLDRKVHLYDLIDKFIRPAESTDSLKAYTKKNQVTEEKEPGLYDNLLLNIKDLDRIANFPTFIDLHIDKLAKDHKTMSNAEIMNMQMNTFEAYLKEAIMLNISPFYIVHGKGTGRLKDEIHYKLTEYIEVAEIDSGYHEGYGTGGATKVHLVKDS